VLIAVGAAFLYRPRPWRETAPGAGYFWPKAGNKLRPHTWETRGCIGGIFYAAREAIDGDSRRPVAITRASPDHQVLTVSEAVNMHRTAERTS
jgi:hypothetical protein